MPGDESRGNSKKTSEKNWGGGRGMAKKTAHLKKMGVLTGKK